MSMEKVFGRHRAEVKTLAGVYGAAYEGDEGFAEIQRDVEAFAAEIAARLSGVGSQRTGDCSERKQQSLSEPVHEIVLGGGPDDRTVPVYSFFLTRRG